MLGIQKRVFYLPSHVLEYNPFFWNDTKIVTLECCLNADKSRAFPGGITWQAKIKLQMIFILACESSQNYWTVNYVPREKALKISALE